MSTYPKWPLKRFVLLAAVTVAFQLGAGAESWDGRKGTLYSLPPKERLVVHRPGWIDSERKLRLLDARDDSILSLQRFSWMWQSGNMRLLRARLRSLGRDLPMDSMVVLVERRFATADPDDSRVTDRGLTLFPRDHFRALDPRLMEAGKR